MKARTETSEAVYSSDSFNTYASDEIKLVSNYKENYDKPKKIKDYSNNGMGPKKESSVFNYAITSDDNTREKEMYPLHFDTNEVLEETPAILKSLSYCGRGPDTFIYSSSPKPMSLCQNDDPCKTFVITSANGPSIIRKNTYNQTLAVNGLGNKIKSEKADSNEYLSYVIEKSSDSERSNMSERKPIENTEIIENMSQVDFGISDENLKNVESETFEPNNKKQSEVKENFQNEFENLKTNSSKSEICDKNVKSAEEEAWEQPEVLSFDKTIAGKKEQAFAKLQDELQKAHQELKLKDEEVTRLTRIREDVERELEELTASLFQEAHKMVSAAKEKQASAEKTLKESQMKVEVLTAEVIALKTLVLTSTPSRPNPHLHPQIGKEDNSGGVNLFARKHRRSPSHFNLKYGRENSPPESPVRGVKNAVHSNTPAILESRDISEVDPTVHKEFLNWSLKCKLDKTDPFIDRIYREDINLCLDFSNRELAEEVQKAIENRNIFIEAVTDKSKSAFPRKCALLEVTRQCHYRMKLGDEDTWHNISQMCRNRIIAVCDFINYLRYIELGLVKSSAHDMYWEIMRLRKEMVLARLGLFSLLS